MQIHRSDDAGYRTPPEQAFTGDVRIGGYVQRSSPSRLAGARVAFAPGARTPWKTNPAGQTLIVLSGTGFAQIEGEPITALRAGDVAWIPPRVRHWDGAAPDEPMTLVALQELVDGVGVRFAEAVTDEQYGAPGADRGGSPADR